MYAHPLQCLELLAFLQTKSCSSFPEWLRLSFRPDRTFWAGEVWLCSKWMFFGTKLRFCPVQCRLFLLVMFWSTCHHVSTSSVDLCVVLEDVSAAGDVTAESSPSMYSTTCRGLNGPSSIPLAVVITWWGCWVLFQWPSEFWEHLCVSGSGEGLRLLSALSREPLFGRTASLVAQCGKESRVPALWCR